MQRIGRSDEECAACPRFAYRSFQYLRSTPRPNDAASGQREGSKASPAENKRPPLLPTPTPPGPHCSSERPDDVYAHDGRQSPPHNGRLTSRRRRRRHGRPGSARTPLEARFGARQKHRNEAAVYRARVQAETRTLSSLISSNCVRAIMTLLPKKAERAAHSSLVAHHNAYSLAGGL